MHIAMIGPRTPYPRPSGGIDFYVRGLSEYLAREGHRVTVCCHKKPSSLPSPLPSAIQLSSIWTLPVHHWDTFFHALFASIKVLFGNADIIHYHGGSSLFSWVPRFFGKKIVVTFHSQEWHHTHLKKAMRIFHFLAEWFGCKCAHRIGTVSKEMQKRLEAKHHRKVFWVPLGTSPPPDRRQERVTKFGLKFKNYILYLGRLAKGKGIEFLLTAFQSLRKEIPYPLVIAGKPLYANDYLETLKKQAPANVFFMGEVTGEAKQEIFSGCLLYVQASSHEGLSLSLLEALNQGCAVLVSDIPSNVEIVGPAGFYFKNYDLGDFILRLKEIVARPDKLKKMAEKARQKIQSEFSWEKRGPALLDFYQNL